MPPECRMTLEARREDNDTDTALLVKLQDLKIGDQALEEFCQAVEKGNSRGSTWSCNERNLKKIFVLKFLWTDLP